MQTRPIQTVSPTLSGTASNGSCRLGHRMGDCVATPSAAVFDAALLSVAYGLSLALSAEQFPTMADGLLSLASILPHGPVDPSLTGRCTRPSAAE